jgi:hypothetical protein
MKWTTADGRELEVWDMDDKHVKNVINQIRRKAGDRDLLTLILRGMDYYKKEAEKAKKKRKITINGEIAQEFADNYEFYVHSGMTHEEYEMYCREYDDNFRGD